ATSLREVHVRPLARGQTGSRPGSRHPRAATWSSITPRSAEVADQRPSIASNEFPELVTEPTAPLLREQDVEPIFRRLRKFGGNVPAIASRKMTSVSSSWSLERGG